MNIVKTWRTALRGRVYRDQLITSVVVLAVAVPLTGSFLNYIGARMGTVLHDPLLELFPPVDFKWITFGLIYAGLGFGVIFLLLHPYALLLALRGLIVLIGIRVVCLLLVPLDPPDASIPLVDPFVQLPGIRAVNARDLFFSWQVAIMALFVFTARWNDMKIIFTCVAVAVSALLLLQHAHYTIDIIAAPCFAYVAFAIARWRTVQEVVGPPGRIANEKVVSRT
ncbi:MAG: hypothetical protein AB1428_09010 [Bacteroidota bacterium]